MKCVLICGLPASGKSTLARALSQRLGIPMFSKDSIKELLYDTVGFRCREEKVALGVGAMEAMYYSARQVLATGQSVILENNFETASLPGLRALLKETGCGAVTVMLTGDYETIYRRFVERDLSPARHRGHVVNTQYPEPPGERPPYTPMGLEAYIAGFRNRGMESFSVEGPRLLVDATDFAQMDLDGLANTIRGLLAP